MTDPAAARTRQGPRAEPQTPPRDVMHATYTRIFTRLGLRFLAVAADTGAIGGTGSHEFQVLAASGEDAIAWCADSDYAANVELAEALAPRAPRPAPAEALRKVPTPGKTRCEDVAALLKTPGKAFFLIAENKNTVILSNSETRP